MYAVSHNSTLKGTLYLKTLVFRQNGGEGGKKDPKVACLLPMPVVVNFWRKFSEVIYLKGS